MSDGITININAASEEASKKLNEFFHGINEKLGELTKAGQFVTGLGEKIIEAFSIAAIVEGFNKAVESAEEFGEAVEKTGLSIKALNALRFQAIESPIPIPFGSLVNALSTFNDKVYLAVRLGGNAARMFRDMGIALTDTSGNMRSIEAILADVMDKFKSMPDGFQKNAAAMQFFGRVGRELIPMFNEGSDAMEKMQHAGGIDEGMIKNAQEFHRAWAQLSEAFQQVFLDASKDIIPILKDLVAWVGDLEKGTGGEMKASEGLVISFKALATVIVDLKSVFVILGETIGAVLALDFENLKVALQTLINLTGEWKRGLSGVIDVLKNLGGAMSSARSNIFHDLAAGDFSKAFGDYKTYLGQVKDAAVGASKQVKQSWGNQFDALAEGWKKGAANTKSILGQLGDDITKEATTFTNAINSIWSKAKGSGSPNAAAGGEGGGAAAGQHFGGPAEPNSVEAQKVLDEIDKAWAESTESKVALLAYERDKLKEKLDEELHDEEELVIRKYQVDELYARKQIELINKQKQEKAEIALADQQAKVKAIEGNPDKTDLEKRAEIIPLLQRELELNRQNVALNQSRVSDPALSDDAHIAAQKELVKLGEQRVALEQNLRNLSSQDFTGKMRDGLTALQNQWGNLGQNLANGTLNAIKNGVQGISDGIMGAITHTRTWGQVFSQIGIGIISTIVQIVVQWIASMTIIAGLKKLFGSQDTTEATKSAASWTPAAIAASIATEGTAAVAGGVAFAAAMLAGTALSAGLSSASGYESGGIIPGGQQYIRVNEKGTEAVLNNKAVRALGPNFINRLNAGIADIYDFANTIPHSITRPITSDPAFIEAMKSGKGGAGGATVQGHKLTAIFPKSSQELREFLQSAEGERLVVDTVKRRRVDIGINT